MTHPYDSQNKDKLEVLSVLSIIAILMRRARMIGISTLVAACAAIVLSLLLPARFTAKAIIMPPQQQTSSSALLSQLGSLAAIGGAGSSLGLKSPGDLYVGILESRTIADHIIKQFGLENEYKLRRADDIRLELKNNTEVISAKDGLIEISVTDHDPVRASDLTNAYVEALYNMNSGLAVSEASQRRAFFDQQLDYEKTALSTAEEAFRNVQQKTGLIQVSGQAQVAIQTISRVQAEIAAREVSLQGARMYSTDENPTVIQLKSEIATMRQQLLKLEDDQRNQTQPGDTSLPANRFADDSLEYTRKLRDVRYHETLFDLLSRQYEAARIDEAQSAPIIGIVDHAVPPSRKSGPHRLIIIIGVTLAIFFISCLVAYIQAGIQMIRGNPQKMAQWQELFRTPSEQRHN